MLLLCNSSKILKISRVLIYDTLRGRFKKKDFDNSKFKRKQNSRAKKNSKTQNPRKKKNIIKSAQKHHQGTWWWDVEEYLGSNLGPEGRWDPVSTAYPPSGVHHKKIHTPKKSKDLRSSSKKICLRHSKKKSTLNWSFDIFLLTSDQDMVPTSKLQVTSPQSDPLSVFSHLQKPRSAASPCESWWVKTYKCQCLCTTTEIMYNLPSILSYTTFVDICSSPIYHIIDVTTCILQV